MFKSYFLALSGALSCYVVAGADPNGNATITLSIKLRESLSRSGENSPKDVQNLSERASQLSLSLEPFIIPPSLSESRANPAACAVVTDPVEEYEKQLMFGLGRFFETTVHVNELENALSTFRNMTEVESVQVAPEIALWEDETITTDISADTRATQDYSKFQAYFYGPTPMEKYKIGGINAKELHDRYPQVKGKNARIVSVENFHWLYSHEDLPKPWITHWQPQQLGSHDTKSAGIMFAKDNGFGVVGIATGAAAGYSRIGTSGQLPDLAKYLKAGDVLQLGVQAVVPGTNPQVLVPIEYHDAVRAAIQYLVDKKGVHVIYAAGNGYLNVDKYVPRSKDSGAIVAGALNPFSGSRADYSNFGKRVDLFSWGYAVTTTSANEATPGIENLYVHNFSGTSSANPILAGGVALLQSIAFELGMGPVPPRLMREALVETGLSIPKPDQGQHQVQPDLVKALEYLLRELPPPKKVDCNGWIGPQTFPSGAECDKLCKGLCSDKNDVLACMQTLVNDKCVYPTSGGGAGGGNGSTTITPTQPTTTTITTTAITTTTTTTTSKGGSNGKDCIGIASWSASKVYNQYAEKVVYNGKQYKQNFYSINAPPAENHAEYGKPWILIGSC